MESLKKHWALLAVLVVLFAAYQVWKASKPEYSYSWVNGTLIRANLNTGQNDQAHPLATGWTIGSRSPYGSN